MKTEHRDLILDVDFSRAARRPWYARLFRPLRRTWYIGLLAAGSVADRVERTPWYRRPLRRIGMFKGAGS